MDLFIKERLPDGSFGDLKPAFEEGMTTEQKLELQIKRNEEMKQSFDDAILELTMLIAGGA